jgi:hypothetical protein
MDGTELANDLHKFDPESLEWTTIVVKGDLLPPPRVHPGFASVNGKLFVFGGVLDCKRPQPLHFSTCYS